MKDKDLIMRAAHQEGIEPKKLEELLRGGRAVLPCNPIHSPVPVAIGEGLRVKVNANIGTSRDYTDISEELKKAAVAIKYGADAVMDLSTGGDIDEVRRRVLDTVKLPVGTVPIYQQGIEKARRGAVVDLTEDDIFGGIERHAKDGVDFMTVHCGITRESVQRLRRQRRLTSVVSRGGAFLVAWMVHNEKENPLYENYDYLLELAKKYEFTLSLGDGLRPGSIADATDRPQIQELLILGELVERARASGVQVIVEGPGHIPIDQIEANVRIEKSVCKGAPFYVLGPLVTDIAPGYDHITAAIGGALAAYHGADFLCYVTPSEHLALPTIEDVRTGVVSARIAAHAADIARGRDLKLDERMSRFRKELDWKGMFDTAIDPELARERWSSRATKSEACSMCGDVCAMRIMSEYLEGRKGQKDHGVC